MTVKTVEHYFCDRCGDEFVYDGHRPRVFDLKYMTSHGASRSGSGSSIGRDLCADCSETFLNFWRKK